MELKDRLKQLRLDSKKTQKEVAQSLGIKEQAYQKYEYGTITPRIDIIIKLSNIYNVTTDYILKGVK
ncbi:helix-turn-helix domain-containing protein [Megamonas hypermegale]|uniref:helix-turn-helix domain-containing protein n=1 Tax=Megamonas hypermegale TaxID=158847 RepID=UPI0026F349F2|nr:helix-turn-helix transcriptional regulator [Megamonas hypermegale]